jgi:hypothetical protein
VQSSDCSASTIAGAVADGVLTDAFAKLSIKASSPVNTRATQRARQQRRSKLDKRSLELFAESAFNNATVLKHWMAELRLGEYKSNTKARKALRKVHINIYDLLAGDYHLRFKTVGELRKHTMETGDFFPKDQAKAAGLKDFLRHF